MKQSTKETRAVLSKKLISNKKHRSPAWLPWDSPRKKFVNFGQICSFGCLQEVHLGLAPSLSRLYAARIDALPVWQSTTRSRLPREILGCPIFDLRETNMCWRVASSPNPNYSSLTFPFLPSLAAGEHVLACSCLGGGTKEKFPS